MKSNDKSRITAPGMKYAYETIGEILEPAVTLAVAELRLLE
jgi:hypothetical protein